jgi:nucleoside-diphosphate-sugar epimerase
MYVEDATRWLVRLAVEPSLRGETVNIGSGIETSILNLAQMIIAKVGSDSEIQFGAPRPGDLPRLIADVSKATSYVPFALEVGLSEGLDRTISYFRQFDPVALLELELREPWRR